MNLKFGRSTAAFALVGVMIFSSGAWSLPLISSGGGLLDIIEGPDLVGGLLDGECGHKGGKCDGRGDEGLGDVVEDVVEDVTGGICKGELPGLVRKLIFKKHSHLDIFDKLKLDVDLGVLELEIDDGIELELSQDGKLLYHVLVPASSIGELGSLDLPIWKLLGPVEDLLGKGGLCKADFKHLLHKVKGKVEGKDLSIEIEVDGKPVKLDLDLKVNGFCFEAELECKALGKTLRCNVEIEN